MKLLSLLLCIAFFTAPATAQQNNSGRSAAGLVQQKNNPSTEPATQYSSYVIRSEAGTFGYAVLANGNMVIWQTNIPGMPGNKGFAQKEQAERCAALVIRKMKAGETPPTVSVKELEKIMQ